MESKAFDIADIGKIAKLTRYGVDSITTILDKIDRLVAEGLTFEEAVNELENYYKS